PRRAGRLAREGSAARSSSRALIQLHRPRENLMTTSTPGSFIWYDLLSSDPSTAIAFYGEVLGWSSRPMEGGSGYTLFMTAQGPHAGTIQMPDKARQMGVPPHWTSNVQVTDVDATVAKAKELGGRVHSEPADFPGVGRLAVIGDPFGASINL